jgi:outer membrane biogenesis lipoprotein LolB
VIYGGSGLLIIIKSELGRLVVAGLGAVLLLLACTTAAERRAAENARIEKQAAAEINRICALPEAEREAELKKIKDQSGMVLYCGSK